MLWSQPTPCGQVHEEILQGLILPTDAVDRCSCPDQFGVDSGRGRFVDPFDPQAIEQCAIGPQTRSTGALGETPGQHASGMIHSRGVDQYRQVSEGPSGTASCPRVQPAPSWSP